MKSKYLMIGAAVCAALFLFSGIMLCRQYADEKQSTEAFEQVAALVETESAPADTPQETEPLSELAAFEKYRAVQEQNSDFVGWLSVPGTNIDYPVMQTVDKPNFYLKRGFDKQYSDYGVPYLDEKTTIGANAQSNNLIVYGHNMKTGTIFGCLTEYKKAAYYQEHPYIEFDTLYGDAKYEVFAAFAIDVVQDTSFVYNQYVDMDEDTYNDYVAEVIRRSDVDSGIRPEYGEQLLTLSTCEYSSANGRYVVVARKVSS